jgi:diguanylate cyclase (GGDEF)-like protein
MNNSQLNSLKGNILIVDDIPDNLRVLSAALTEKGYKVRSVVNGEMALRATNSAPPDLILLDIKMPDMDGYEVCKKLKKNAKTATIPVIFLSALDEILDKVKAFNVGGVDYITKPFQFEEVLVRVENQLQLRAAKAEVEILNRELEQRVSQRTAQLEKEISERQHIQEKLMHMALHDPLTDLPNRTWLMKRLEQVFSRSKHRNDYLFAVLFLDCDRFKIINDSLGHLVGDQLLISVARRLESALQPEDTIARFGGDEFVILLEKIKAIDDAIYMAQKLQRELSLAFHLEDQEIFINASIGIVLGNSEYQQPAHILRDADLALYKAKALGKNRYKVFDQEMHIRAIQRLQLETDLRRALEREEFINYYQPIICLADQKIVGFEALVRWNHPNKGLTTPGEFIFAAEETGLIVMLDRQVLDQACQQLKQWQKLFNIETPFMLSVNFSVQQLAKADLIQIIDEILLRTNIEPKYLKLEITENALIENNQLANSILKEIKQRQIQISIDDFGTGYSSLSYLHSFPIDILKIDQTFVKRIGLESKNLELVQAIVTLAHTLEMKVVAEGIETEQQYEQLKALGCEFGQGFLFAKPLNSEDATVFLASHLVS